MKVQGKLNPEGVVGW